MRGRLGQLTLSYHASLYACCLDLVWYACPLLFPFSFFFFSSFCSHNGSPSLTMDSVNTQVATIKARTPCCGTTAYGSTGWISYDGVGIEVTVSERGKWNRTRCALPSTGYLHRSNSLLIKNVVFSFFFPCLFPFLCRLLLLPCFQVDISSCGFTVPPILTTSLVGVTTHWQVTGGSAPYYPAAGPSTTTFKIFLTAYNIQSGYLMAYASVEKERKGKEGRRAAKREERTKCGHSVSDVASCFSLIVVLPLFRCALRLFFFPSLFFFFFFFFSLPTVSLQPRRTASNVRVHWAQWQRGRAHYSLSASRCCMAVGCCCSCV